MQVCTSLQADSHASTPPLIFTGQMPFLPPNQQRQSTEGITNKSTRHNLIHFYWLLIRITTLQITMQKIMIHLSVNQSSPQLQNNKTRNCIKILNTVELSISDVKVINAITY